MTVAMQSFDASPLGSFIRSPLGARNGRPTPPEVRIGTLTMVWIDETTMNPTYVPDRYGWYEEDLVALRAGLQVVWGADEVVSAKGLVSHVYSDFYGRWEPIGDIPTDIVIKRRVQRSPTLAGNQFSFRLAVRSNSDPSTIRRMARLDGIKLVVDCSGSMTRNTIEPGFTEFREWLLSMRGQELDSQSGIMAAQNMAVSVDEPQNERWLQWLHPTF